MKWGAEHAGKHDLSSLRLLGSVGEPINPKAWLWYHKVIGGERCPIVDTWWQTETGGIVITPMPGATAMKPGSASKPLPGFAAAVVDEDGKPMDPTRGLLTLDRPGRRCCAPSTATTTATWRPTSSSSARRPTWSVTPPWMTDDYFWVIGRIDDVINVSGHRLSTAEIESALVSHERWRKLPSSASPTRTPVSRSWRS